MKEWCKQADTMMAHSLQVPDRKGKPQILGAQKIK
jgi:hypothetical protein